MLLMRRCLPRSPIQRWPFSANACPNGSLMPLLRTASLFNPRYVVGGERFYARRRKKISEHAETSMHEPMQQGEASAEKKWKWSGWISTKRDIKSAVEECARKIRPHFEGSRPDVCFVWSSHENVGQLKKIPSLLRRTLSPRFIFGSSSMGVFGSSLGMKEARELTSTSGLCITAARMPQVDIYPFYVNSPSLPSFPKDFDWASHTLKKNGCKGKDSDTSSALFLVTDGVNFREDEFLKRLDFAFPTCHKFGGLSSSRDVCMFVNNKVYSKGAIGLLLHGKFDVLPIKSESYRPLGHPLVVSSVTSFDEAAMESMIAQVEGEEDEEYEDSEQQLPSGLVFAEDSGIEGDEDENEEENEGLFDYDEDEDEETDMTSVIYSLNGQSVCDALEEIGSGLNKRDCASFYSGQFLVGIEAKEEDRQRAYLEDGASRSRGNYLMRNIKEMGFDDGGFIALYEPVPQKKRVQFFLKDRVRGLVDLEEQLQAAKGALNLDKEQKETDDITGGGCSEIGAISFSSIGRSLFAKAREQALLDEENIYPLPMSTSKQGNNDDNDAISYLEAGSQDNPQSDNLEDDIVDWSPIGGSQMDSKDKTSHDGAAQANVSSPCEEVEEEEDSTTIKPENSSEQESKEQQEIEEKYGPLTDAQIFKQMFGSKATLSGSYTKGEFHSLENEGQCGEDDDDKSTLLHGYINSIAIIGPPKPKHQHNQPKENTQDEDHTKEG